MAESDSRSQPSASWCPPLSRCQMLKGQEPKAQMDLACIPFAGSNARTVNREGSSPARPNFMHSGSNIDGSHWVTRPGGIPAIAQGSMAPRVGELNATNPHTLTCTAREGPRVKERQTERQRDTHRDRETERMNKRPSFPGPRSHLLVVGLEALLHKFRPHWFVQGHKAALTHERRCHIHETPVGT